MRSLQASRAALRRSNANLFGAVTYRSASSTSSASTALTTPPSRTSEGRGPLAPPDARPRAGQHAFFSSTPAAAKKKGKPTRKPTPDELEPASAAAAAEDKAKPDAADAYNFADVEAEWERAAAFYRDEVQKIKLGGRFNPDLVGAIPVQPDRAARPRETYPLRELAQIVHLGGRSVSLLASDEAMLKPISSAVQRSPDFNQQPQPSPDNPLELLIKIEMDRPEDQARRLRDKCHQWRERIQTARTKRDKTHHRWEKAGSIRRDDRRQLDKVLQGMLTSQIAAVDKEEKAALQVIQSQR